MRHLMLVLIVSLLLFVGCGGGGGTADVPDEPTWPADSCAS